jgi:hypothetical protein
MEFDSGLHNKFFSSNQKFRPSDLISHINKKRNELLWNGVTMYLNKLYGDAFGDGEFI